ncbi:MAG TPA: LiaF domain-containing protein [Chloroflexota bacterium]|nr:LiaF domain-containing protein [Chloroflexota bacterium]
MMADPRYYLSEYDMTEAPPMPPSTVSLFGSIKRKGRVIVPPEVHLTVAFGELKLDLREAIFPEKHVLFVANAFCSSLEVLLPEGVNVDDRSMAIMASHHTAQEGEEHGPVIHIDGWSICSDVKFTTIRGV